MVFQLQSRAQLTREFSRLAKLLAPQECYGSVGRKRVLGLRPTWMEYCAQDRTTGRLGDVKVCAVTEVWSG